VISDNHAHSPKNDKDFDRILIRAYESELKRVRTQVRTEQIPRVL